MVFLLVKLLFFFFLLFFAYILHPNCSFPILPVPSFSSPDPYPFYLHSEKKQAFQDINQQA